jgi:hypothetical protein
LEVAPFHPLVRVDLRLLQLAHRFLAFFSGGEVSMPSTIGQLRRE